MSAGECGSRFVGHGVDDPQKCVGEGHTGQTLGVMHLLPGGLVSQVRRRKMIQYHFNGFEGERVREGAVQRGNIRLYRMRQSIHPCIGNLPGRQTLYQLGIYNCHVWGDVKIGQGIFDPGLVVGDYRESGDLCRSAGCGGYCRESGEPSQFREMKGDA